MKSSGDGSFLFFLYQFYMHTSVRCVLGRGELVSVGLLGTSMVGASWLLGMFAELRGCCARDCWGWRRKTWVWKGSVQVRGLPAVGGHPDKGVAVSGPAGVTVGGNRMEWGLAAAFPPKHTESGSPCMKGRRTRAAGKS